jgi:hypothetical protein
LRSLESENSDTLVRLGVIGYYETIVSLARKDHHHPRGLSALRLRQ